MPSVFLSYSHEDLPLIQQLEAQLKAYPGISIWRDQDKIYGEQKWPRVLGQAIANQDIFLLAWSKNTAHSPLVEFEWNTALALGKTIVLCISDGTRPPSSLSSIRSISINNISQIAASLTGAGFVEDAARRAEVLRMLDQIISTEPERVLQATVDLFNQPSWTVHGSVIQGDHVIVQIGEGANQSAKNLVEKWRDWIAFAVGIVGLIISIPMFMEPSKNGSPELSPSAPSTTSVKVEQPKRQTLGGAIRSEGSDPLDGVKVSLPHFKLETTTDKFGQFRLEVTASDQETVALLAQKPGYQTYEADVTLGNPALGFTMRKNP